VRLGTVEPAAAELLAAVVAARLAYLVVGGTGSGKTTLLATLLGRVPPDERIVIVETPPSCGRCTRTSSRWRHARPTWRARAR
jgi:Flp pilus assembly CpaF family ATPase